MKQFKALRRAGVPIAGIETADPMATMVSLTRIINGDKKDEGTSPPVCCWDVNSGLVGLNKAGAMLCSDIGADAITTGNPQACLVELREKLSRKHDDAVFFFCNAQRIIDDLPILQGVWNLRDKFKEAHRTLVMLGPTIKLPPELQQDVVIISEPLPGDDELGKLALSIADDAGFDSVKQQTKEKLPVVVDTLRGLSAFAAEQVYAMSIDKNGLDMDSLWSLKRKMIEQTPGLEVWKGGETFDDLGGLANLKTFLTSVLTSGKTPVRAIGFVDEIEKALGGAGGDLSGTSQDQLGVLLKVMQDDNIPGIILLGPPGTGKSAIAKAAGAVADAPVISIDTGAMKSSLVGSSEARIRTAMNVFKAVSQGKGIFIATCNKITSLPPELKRRFTLGTFFVDLPTRDDRVRIWSLWAKRYGITEKITEDILDMSHDWSGAEVKACCDVAFRTGFSLAESSKFIVPVIKAAPESVTQLRQMANGKFISADRPGIYEMAAPEAQVTERSARRFERE